MEEEKLKEEIENLLETYMNDEVFIHYNQLPFVAKGLVKLFEKWHKDEIISNLEEIKHKLS